jgi:glycosyltransferase involved in cell wall biosynthesis
MSRSRILFVNQHYWPDVASTGQHLADLAEYLAERDFEVHVLCGRGAYVGGRAAVARETYRAVVIHRAWTPGFGRRSHAGRIAEYAGIFAAALTRLLAGRRFDAVVLLTTPPLLAAAGAVARVLRGRPFGIWSMDLHPEAEFALGMIERSGLVGRALAAIDGWALRKALFVVCLGPVMRERLLQSGVDPGRVETIPVWSRADEVEPIGRDENPLRQRLGLDDDFVVMYSGNAGLAHTFREVLDAAERLRGEGVRFLFVGDGPRRSEIEREAAARGLSHVTYRDYFPREDLRYSLGLGDLHLLTLRPEMAGVAVPGKLYGIMAAGRPVAVVAPEHSEPAETVAREGFGVVIDPADAGAGARLAAAIRAYRDDTAMAELHGRRAREAFLERYEAKHSYASWAALLERVLSQSAPRRR